MANRFDDVAKALATGMPRRKVLKILVGGAAVATTTAIVDKDSTAQALPVVNNTYPRPVITIPVPQFPLPGVNQTNPGVVVPPKLNLLPKLIPQINWNFVPLYPRKYTKKK